MQLDSSKLEVWNCVLHTDAGAAAGGVECEAGAELGAGCICAGPGCCLKMGS